MKRTIKNTLKKIRNIIFFIFFNSIKKRGNNNNIKSVKSCILKNCAININGNNNSVIFNENCNITGLRILILGDNNTIEFGKNVIINASKTQPTVINAVGGHNILIGDESLFSNNIEIHTTDYHGIYDKSGKRINNDKDIIIGNHVWIGLGCKILKGSIISNGSIVGAGSLVSGTFKEENIIIAGIPAKIIKHQVFWDDNRNPACLIPDELKSKWNV